MARRMPAGALGTLEKVEKAACQRGWRIYLAGGAVRDLLLRRPVLDIDLVVEGDAVQLAVETAKTLKAGRLTIHPPFLTASIRAPGLNMDFATARTESYTCPGALPSVRPAKLDDDLRRRDFSINAMAVSLNSADFGTLIDYCGGQADLKAGLIRVLHEESFRDDATRIWRAVRYEQRLGFAIERQTLTWLRHDLDKLQTVSGERIRHELECVFAEPYPEKVFRRATGLGIPKKLHPRLTMPRDLARWYARVRRVSTDKKTRGALYLALLTYNTSAAAAKQVCASLGLDKKATRIIDATHSLKSRLDALDDHPLQPSAIYQILNGYAEEAILANLTTARSGMVRRNIRFYLDELRYVKTELAGGDLLAIGMKKGPQIKAALEYLLAARLDGEVRTRRDEEKWLKESGFGN